MLVGCAKVADTIPVKEMVSVCRVQPIQEAVDPLKTASDLVNSDAAILTKSLADKVAAQKALEVATNNQTAAVAKLATDRAAYLALLDGVNVAPVPQKELKITMVGATYCGACKKMLPILDELTKQGINIVKIDSDVEACPFSVSGYPTFIFTVDGMEKSRTTAGILEKEKLINWWNTMVNWSKGK